MLFIILKMLELILVPKNREIVGQSGIVIKIHKKYGKTLFYWVRGAIDYKNADQYHRWKKMWENVS